MACFCGHAEEEHRSGQECQVPDCDCVMYEKWEEEDWTDDN